MVSIKRTNWQDAPLTILTVSGVLTREELIHTLEDFFKNNVTLYLLWDFTDADLTRITRKDMDQVIIFAKSDAHFRKAGRTAFLVSKDLSFGLSRMYEMLSEFSDHPIKHRVFTDMEKAITWLKPG